MENGTNKKDNILRVGIITAIVTGILALINSAYISHKSLELEKKQFESNLVLKLIEPNDTAKSVKNIKFFIEAGFLSKDNEKLIFLIPKYIIKTPKNDTISITPKNNIIIKNGIYYLGRVIDEHRQPMENVKIQIIGSSNNYETITDNNGSFKILLPSENIVIMSITKDNYKPIRKRYISRQLQNLKEIILEANK